MFDFMGKGMILADINVNGTLTFTSANIVDGGFSLNRYSTSAIAPEFGNVSAGELTILIDTSTIICNVERGDVVTGRWYVASEPTTEGEFGEFIVTNVIKGSDTVEITCLDKMILLDGEADLTGITYPINASAFINTVYGTGLGLTVEILTDVDTSLGDPLFETGTTYRQVLSKVYECIGANAWYKDKLYIGWYEEVQATADDEIYISADLTETAFSISVEATKDYTKKPVEITDDVITLRVVDNPFIANYTDEQRQSLATAIKGNIGNVSWYGGNVTILPSPDLDVMNIITVVDKDGNNRAFPLTSVTYGINENTKLESKISSEDNGYNDTLTRDVETLKREVEDVEENNKHFFYRDDSGVHITMVENNYNTGRNVHVDSNGFYVRNDDKVITSIGEDIQIGETDKQKLLLTSDGFTAYNPDGVGFFDIDFDGGSKSVWLYDNTEMYSIDSVLLDGESIVEYEPTLISNGTPPYKIIGNGLMLSMKEYNVTYVQASPNVIAARVWPPDAQHPNSYVDFTVQFQFDDDTDTTFYVIMTAVRDNIQYSIKTTFLFTIEDGEPLIKLSVTREDGEGDIPFEIRGRFRYSWEQVVSVPSFTFGTRSGESGGFSVVEGEDNEASGQNSHAEGSGTTASGDNSHAEGTNTTASGLNSYAEGYLTTASGENSHAAGDQTTASGINSFASGFFTRADEPDQFVIGRNNDNKVENVFEIGNGAGEPSNAFTVDWSGNVEASGDVTVGGDVIVGSDEFIINRSTFEYLPGETVSLSSVGHGYSTGTSGNYYFFLSIPKRIPVGATLTATALTTNIRGVNGRVTNNANNLSNVSGLTRREDGTLNLALTGITNLFQANTPAHILASITFDIT